MVYGDALCSNTIHTHTHGTEEQRAFYHFVYQYILIKVLVIISHNSALKTILLVFLNWFDE